MFAPPSAADGETLPACDGALDVYFLGLLDFDSAVWLQDRLLSQTADRNGTGGALLVCEHPPLITIGREGSQRQLRCEAEELRARQIDVRWLSRGGEAVVHAPGQIAAYPIVPVERRRVGLAPFRDAVLSSVVDICAEFRVPADREPGSVVARGGRLATAGLAVRSGISCQGLFVNIAPRMDLQRLVEPVSGMRQTCLSAERLRPLAMSSARESLVRCLSRRLGYVRYHLYTGHPLLRRTRRVVTYA